MGLRESGAGPAIPPRHHHMHIVITPNLDGLAGERLRAFAVRLTGFASGDPAIRAAAQSVSSQ